MDNFAVECKYSMSYQQVEDFYYMAEDFVDDIDEDNYDRAGGDMDADEYDLVCLYIYIFVVTFSSFYN